MTDNVTTASTLSTLVQTVHDRKFRFALRSQPQHDMIADIEPALQAMPGNVVTLHLWNDLSPATTALSETTDVDRVTMSESSITVTLVEQGNAVGLTALLRATGLGDVDEGVANTLAYNLVDSVDVIARDVLAAGTNVLYSGGKTSRATLQPESTFASDDIRKVVAKLRVNKAQPRKNGYYVGLIHPHVSYDLRREAGTNATYRESHVYSSPEAIYAGEIGEYEGAVFIETPRAKIFSDAGSSNSPTFTDVYATIFVGQQALAKAVAITPHMVLSPITDRLRRLPSWGWYGLFGYSRYRENAIYRVESGSSLDAKVVGGGN